MTSADKGMSALLPSLLIGCALLASCGGPDPGPAADKLAAGLSRLDLSGVALSAQPAQARDQLAVITKGMDGLKPRVRVVDVDKDDKRADATLAVSWRLADGVDWSYRTAATLTLVNEHWKVRWSPSIVAPRLGEDRRLALRRVQPVRGTITGAEDQPIVEPRAVIRVGIDKSTVQPDVAARSARTVARLVEIDADRYAGMVEKAGPKAFVEAIVLRKDADAPLARIDAVPGALTIDSTLPLAPSRTFAAPILGTVGEATEELIADSRGRLRSGDQTGLSGLQRRYDTSLRGVDGVRVDAVSIADDSAAAVRLFSRSAVDGKPLGTTIDPRLQSTAETALASTRPASALVAIRPSSGEVLVAASGPGGNGQSTSTVGQFAPGSTFKVVSSLAMLRNGLKPSDLVRCPRTITVGGKSFKNYDDYPADQLGQITLRAAIANSCNTAVISTQARVAQPALTQAAASLGLGVDHDLGFPVSLGSVPKTAGTTEHAASMIGQGKVLASPMAMAAVAASVKSGRTVVPQLITGQKSPTVADTLTSAESAQLRSLMRAVVTDGSGTALRSVAGAPVGAKTGTAEYGTATPPRTHAWMIAYQGDLAVAAFVADGKSGSATAGPILKRFLAAARR